MSKNQIEKVPLSVVRAIADTIRELGSMPSGHLYARVIGYLSIEKYEQVIDILKKDELIYEHNHELFWIGTKGVSKMKKKVQGVHINMKTQNYFQFTWFRVNNLVLLTDYETGKYYLYRPIDGLSRIRAASAFFGAGMGGVQVTTFEYKGRSVEIVPADGKAQEGQRNVGTYDIYIKTEWKREGTVGEENAITQAKQLIDAESK